MHWDIVELYCYIRIVGTFSIFDSSAVSDEDIKVCFEFMEKDKDKRKIEVLREFFIKSFPTLSINPFSNTNCSFSIIVCDTSKNCFTSYSSLYSYSSNVFFIEYSSNQIIIRLFSKCMIICFLLKIALLFNINHEFNEDDKKEVHLDETSNQWKWNGCLDTISEINSYHTCYSLNYETIVFISSILAQECCKVMIFKIYINIDNNKVFSSKKAINDSNKSSC